MIYPLSLCDRLGIDLSAAVQAKIAKNAQKYPVARAKRAGHEIHRVGNRVEKPTPAGLPSWHEV